MILFINACVRKESRTKRLADCLLKRLGEYEEIKLSDENIEPLNEVTLNKRTELISKADYSDKMFDYAKQFAMADTIVIAAPFWDSSFPANLRTYIENIYVTGIVSRYGNDGMPIGLCKASKLYYITTAGGPYIPDYSYDYITQLSKENFGIKETQLIKAEMLDVEGFDAEKIILEKEKEIKEMLI